MATVMIITLGTGREVESGIAKSIHTNNPDKIYFIATNESLATISRIEKELGRKLVYEQPYLVKNPEDVEKCWQTTAQLIRSLLQAGYAPAEICLDFTSGTKAMSAGAVLAGVSLECGYLSYVGGGERDATGRVITGTERVITLTPNAVFIDHRRQLIRNFFNTFQYDSCLKLIEEAQTRVVYPELYREFGQLEDLVHAYSWWDKFDHQKAASSFRLLREFKARWRIDTSDSKEMVFKISRQQEKYASGGNIKDKFSQEVLADLLANADRRAQEGKYDDAVARLYRAVEVVAQMLLAQRGIDTAAVKMEQLPHDWRETYREIEPPIRLGQEKAFALLESLGEETGRIYRENSNLRNYLAKRNSSILAHDLEPMTREIYEHLSREANQLALKAVPRLDSLKAKCRFPLLELT